MAEFSAPFIVYSPDGSLSRTLNGSVDTGASFTVIPENVLDELGIIRDEWAPFSLADGSVRDLYLGSAVLELAGRREIVRVVFGSDPLKTLIGARTLATLRLAVDPVFERLLPVDLIVLLDQQDKS